MSCNAASLRSRAEPQDGRRPTASSAFVFASVRVFRGRCLSPGLNPRNLSFSLAGAGAAQCTFAMVRPLCLTLFAVGLAVVATAAEPVRPFSQTLTPEQKQRLGLASLRPAQL